jgi:DNA invertase Pin-like site-specific DNA recombinase
VHESSKQRPLLSKQASIEWTRTQRIRTAGQVELEAALIDAGPAPVYEQIAAKAKHLRELGMSDRLIARTLGVSDKTVAKATQWPRRHQGRG